MSVGSVKSAFSFESYKVDDLKLYAAPNISLLSFRGVIPEDEWHVSLSIREPHYFEENSAYVGGLDLSLALFTDVGKEKVKTGEEVSEEDYVLRVEGGIAGLFTTENGAFDKVTEEGLVKIQIPALLLPYLRGTITSLLANSGYGTVILPLINIHAVAEEQLKDVKVKVVK